ncbi:MAG: hypothetical protein J0H67_17125, partial [Rhodospirillales bacterium]|nr:hypothetical protein [Rhodospirillales bacterium]
MIDTNSVLGYAWPLIVSPGEPIGFHLSSATLASAEATVVRVRLADPDPNGPGLQVTEPGTPIDGPVALRHQPIHPGSCAIVADAPVLAALRGFSVGCFLWPTRLEAGAQTILARWCDDAPMDARGWRFGLTADGCLELVVAGVGRVATTRPLLAREWVFVGGSYDPADATLSVVQVSLDRQAGRDWSDAVTAPTGTA